MKLYIKADAYNELIEKGYGKRDLSKLTRKVITDKNGHRRTVFVRNEITPAKTMKKTVEKDPEKRVYEIGEQVKFKDGLFLGSGVITKVFDTSVIVESKRGIHKVGKFKILPENINSYKDFGYYNTIENKNIPLGEISAHKEDIEWKIKKKKKEIEEEELELKNNPETPEDAEKILNSRTRILAADKRKLDYLEGQLIGLDRLENKLTTEETDPKYREVPERFENMPTEKHLINETLFNVITVTVPESNDNLEKRKKYTFILATPKWSDADTGRYENQFINAIKDISGFDMNGYVNDYVAIKESKRINAKQFEKLSGVDVLKQVRETNSGKNKTDKGYSYSAIDISNKNIKEE